MLTEKKNEDGTFKLYYHNGVYMGDVEMDVDGYYKFWPNKDTMGYWDEESLYSTAEYLKNKNADWDREVQKLLSEQN